MKARTTVLVALFALAATLPAAAAKLKVPQQYPTVSSAVAAASNGDTVEVQGGPYIEQVVINKSIKLVGKPTGVIKAPLTMTGSKAIVLVTGAGVSATIQGLTITGPGDGGCDSIRWGIRVEAGADATIKNNDILEIRDEPIGGCQNGVGIMVGRASESTTGTADIRNNFIAGFQKNGMVISNVGSSACVENNLVQGAGPVTFIAQNGIQVSGGAFATVGHNTVRNMRYTPQTVSDAGILVIGAAAGSDFEHNVVENVDVGFYLFTTSGVNVDHNKSRGSTFDGIIVQQGSGNTVSNNQVEGNSQGGPAFGAGIGLYNATGNFICDNKAKNNLDDGFFADVTSTGNQFDNNHAAKNGAWGFHDVSVGTGTSFTGNTYTGNKANGNTNGDSSPPGLAQ